MLRHLPVYRCIFWIFRLTRKKSTEGNQRIEHFTDLLWDRHLGLCSREPLRLPMDFGRRHWSSFKVHFVRRQGSDGAVRPRSVPNAFREPNTVCLLQCNIFSLCLRVCVSKNILGHLCLGGIWVIVTLLLKRNEQHGLKCLSFQVFAFCCATNGLTTELPLIFIILYNVFNILIIYNRFLAAAVLSFLYSIVSA